MTNSRLTPSGNTSVSYRGARLRSSVFTSSSITDTRCGLPTSTATPETCLPSTTATEVPVTVTGPMCTVTERSPEASPRTRTGRSPALVPTANSGPASSPASTR